MTPPRQSKFIQAVSLGIYTTKYHEVTFLQPQIFTRGRTHLWGRSKSSYLVRVSCILDQTQISLPFLYVDPYHGRGQAHGKLASAIFKRPQLTSLLLQGLCFSVPTGVPVPPSLRNVSCLDLVREILNSIVLTTCFPLLFRWMRRSTLN